MNFMGRLLACASTSVLLAGSIQAVQAQALRWQSMDQASSTTVFTIAFSELLKEELGLDAQVTTGRPIVRQALDAAQGNLDFWSAAVSVNNYLKNGSNMYAELEEAPELFKNIRMIVSYPVGSYHVVTWADSDITSMNDLKGKRVSMGPPAGAASVIISQMIEGATGFLPEQDYTPVALDWNSTFEAFQNRQIDVFFTPTSVPGPSVMQLGTMGDIRLLGLPENSLDTSAIEKAMSVPGRVFAEIAPDAYGDAQVNEEPVLTIQPMVGLGTNKFLDEEIGYNVTKALFENMDDLRQEVPWLKSVTLDTAFAEMNAPLHIGAYRYYREQGVEVPDALVPPEAAE